jgi:hypothetical protein
MWERCPVRERSHTLKGGWRMTWLSHTLNINTDNKVFYLSCQGVIFYFDQLRKNSMMKGS